MDSAEKQQRELIPRGAMPSAISQQKLASLARSEGKAVAASEKCDSGFGSLSIEMCEDSEIRTVEERTQNLTIDDPETNTRHSSSEPTTRDSLSQSEELYQNYAQCNDVRYLLAQDHVRNLLFLQDDDGDT